jgi:hypothetical protein
MATNVFFRTHQRHNLESELFSDLVIESIRIYGVDTVYLTRSLQSVDELLNEDDLSIFNAAYEMEMYVKSVDGFAGEGDFLSRFGLQIRDQVTFTVANRTFEKYVTRLNSDKKRPLEGDLIYFPMNNKFFKIMHVEHESVFYQLGALHVYDLKCELFEYSNERFETGRADVDTYYDKIKTDGVININDLNKRDPIAKNIFFGDEANDILDFSETDPFSEIISTNYAVTSDSTNVSADSDDVTADTV